MSREPEFVYEVSQISVVQWGVPDLILEPLSIITICTYIIFPIAIIDIVCTVECSACPFVPSWTGTGHVVWHTLREACFYNFKSKSKFVCTVEPD